MLFRIKTRLLPLMGLALWCCFGTLISNARAELTVNLVAVNASEEAKEIEVKYALPVELGPSDVLDTGPLKMDYDVDKQSYFVSGKLTFQSKESRVFKIRVNDVWKIPEEEIEILKKQLDENLKSLQDHENYSYAKNMRDRLLQQLEYILTKQAQFKGNVDRRIEEYRAYRKTLVELRSNIYNLDFLKYQSKVLDQMADMNKTIKFVVEVANPAKEKNKTVVHKHYLPEEVRAEHVVETNGFEVRFDEKKQRAFLTKEENFLPGEKKKYEFLIKDIWQFPEMKLDDLADRVLIADAELRGTIFEASGKFLTDKIMNTLGLIRESLTPKQESIKKHIGLFRTNEKRYDEAWQDFKRIEEMIAIVRAKKLEEMESKKVKNILQKLKALRGLSALAEALFKKSISITTTWRIIMGTIIFVALFTTFHFFIWSRRSRMAGEELGLVPGEKIKIVPKPGESEKEEEDEIVT